MFKKIFGLISFIFIMFVLVSCTNRTVELTFNTNEGTSVEKIVIDQGSLVEIPTTSKEGYTFQGWYENSNFDESSKFLFDVPVVRNMTFYAKWSINSYQMVFFPDNDTSIPSREYVYQGDVILPTPTKEGYEFVGWFEGSIDGTRFDLDKMPARNVNLYAKWSIYSYTITFLIDDVVFETKTVTHGGTLTDIPVPPSITGKVRYWDHTDFTNITSDMEVNLIEDDAYYQVVVKDTFGTVYETLTIKHGDPFIPTVTPSKEGYLFVGYNPGINHIITSNLDVMVIYEQITFLVIFRNEQGTPIKEVNIALGEDAVPPTYLAPNGYDFSGWSKSFENVTENLTIDPILTPKTYEVKLNANGGLFEGQQNEFVISAAYLSIIGLPPTPTKEGYQFGGWFDNVDGTGTAYTFSPSTVMPLEGLELFAKWSVRNYSLTYSNLNGTTHSNPTSYTILSNTITLNAPTNRTGYQFIGWFDALTGGNQVTEITLGSTGNKTLYARFSPITYSISYNNLEGTTHSNPETYNIETPIINLANPMSRTGYNFVGWFTALSGGNEVTEITMGSTGNKTLYARFTAKTYTITYNLNGGTGPSTLTVTYNQSFTLGVASKTGYEFTGWMYLGNSFASGTWLNDGDITIDAVYNPITYTITYNNQQGTTHTNPENYTIETTTITLLDPTNRTGYNFIGWFDTLNGGNQVTEITLGSTGNKTLYARFTAKTYTITYNLNGGTGPSTLSVTYNQSFTLGTASKTGYQFTGWTYLGNPFISGTWLIDGDITIVAVYSPVNYTITYNNLEGTTHENPNTYTIETENIFLEEPTNRTGYQFIGWFNQSTSGEEISTISLGSTGNIDLYARFEPITYDITYSDLQGTTHSNPSTYHIETNSFSLTNPTSRIGYQFIGWFDALTDGNQIVSIPKGSFGDLELFARFTPISYTINYQDLFGTTHTNPVNYTIETATITLLEPTDKTGYDFVGWFTHQIGGNEVVSIPQGSTGNKTLYARFTPTTYNITYNNLQGTTHSNPESYNIETATISLLDPTDRAGYNFVGWFDALTGGVEVTEIESGSTEDLELYARFIPITYIVTYGNLQGTIHSNPDNYNIETNTINLVDPTERTGYTFIGWFDALSGGNEVTEITLGTTGDLELYARFTAKSYTLTYNLNGGTGPSTLSVTYNQSFTLGTASKTGYQFTGWTYLGNPFISGTWLIDGDITIDAAYSPITYTITYQNLLGTTHSNPINYTIETSTITLLDPTSRNGYNFIGWFSALNGGTEVETIQIGSTGNKTVYARFSPITYSITYSNLEGTTHSNPNTYTIETATITLLDPTNRTGYNFVGWFDALTGGNEVTEIVLGSTGTLDVYARFSPITYSITYNNLEGTTHSNPENYNIETSTISLLDPSERTGYNFVGWFDALNGGNEVTEITLGTTGNKILYARFTAKTYTITYNLNGGTGPSTLNVTYNQSFTLGVATKDEFTFAGWLYQGLPFTSGTWLIDSDITIDAQWTEWPVITFEVFGGSGVSQIFEAPGTLITAPNNPLKSGFVFEYWYESDDSILYVFDTMPATDLTLYAKYSTEIFNVSYENLEGTTHTNPDTYTIETATIILLDPTSRTGYNFVGWFDALTGGNEVTEITLGSTGNLILYARFTAKTYTLTYNLNGGTGPTTLTVTYNQAYTLGTSVKVGYTFIGWEYDGSPFTSGTWSIDGDITIDAAYSPITYTITYNNLEGTTHTNPDTYTIETSTITLLDPTNRLGYNFVGWFDALSGGNEITEIELGSIGDVELYARFTPITYSITYSNLQGTTHSNPDTYTIETSTITLVDPTERTGYTFIGWFDALSGGNEITEITLGSTGNIEVFARFEAITYSITYSNLQGTTQTNPDTYTIETPTTTLLDPTSRTGYNFTGWYTALSGGTKVETIPLGSVNNLELYARFTPKTYTLTYNLNGGTGPSTLTVTYNQAYTLGTSVKVGYTFTGWEYDGSPFTSGTWTRDSNLTINATYTTLNYNIIYNDLAGTTHDNPSTYTIETPTFNLNSPTNRLGYNFVGWFNASSGGTLVTEITLGSTGTKILYARFEAITYNITYSNLQGTTQSNPNTYTIETSTITLLDPTNRLGYNFVGWFDALTDGFEVTEIILGSTGNIEVFARFEPISYSITYNNLLGTTHSNSLNYHIESETFILTDPTYRIGYEFVGWFDALTGGNEVTEITLGTTGNKILYARFTAKTYTLTYNLNGGTGPTTLNVTYNESFTLSTASKTGYQFTGWTYLGNPFISGTWSIDGDITIDAVYSPITYTITYNNLEGTTHTNPDTYTIETSTITLLDPTYRTGYNFVGWFDALNGGNEVTAITLGSTGDLELFARFTAKSYTVTYNLNGGTGPTTLNVIYNESFTLGVASKTGYEFTGWTYLGDEFVSGTWSIDSNITIEATYEALIYEINYQNLLGTTHSNPENYTIETATITLLDPTNKAGYNFVGWFDALNGGNEVTEITLGSIGNLTLYARFEAITYTVTYLNLFDMIHDNDLIITIESEFILTDPSIRTGYRFLGWFTELESGSRILEINAGNLTGMTLYARWEIAYYDVAGSYVYERLDISEDQTEILETVTNEGSQSFFIPSLLHGTDILPVIEIEGYMFNRLVYNGITYDDIEHLITVVDHIDLENLTIYYRRLILEVVFIQNDEASVPGTSPITYETSIRYTHYNLGIDTLNIPVLYTYSNITSLWERSTISQVQSTMTVSALYFNTTTKTIRFKDGSSIIFIASELGLTPQTEFISVDALIWNLTKPGYRFLGWFYMDGQTEKELTPGSYAFEDFIANQTEIYTKWQQLTAFNQVTNVLVTINGTDDITITWNLDLNGLTNPSFDIYIDQEKVVGYQSIIQQSGNLFTLNIPTSAIDYDLFEKLIEVGMHRVTVQAVGDNVNHMTGLMSEAYIYEVKSIYDENPSNVDTYDYFIVEDYQGTLRYIFYTNMTYQFNSGYQFEIITGSDLVTLNNPYTMKMNQISGQFRFKMTRPDQSFNIYDGLVVKDIKGFSFGTNYQQYLDETGVQSSYVDQSDPYIVGTKNSFYLDLRMTSSTGNRIRLDDALLSYEFYLYNGSTYNLIAANDLSNHVDLLPNNRLQFKTGTKGNMYQVKVSPKYQSTRMTVSELTFEFVVNAGYNAFTHQDLKEFFSDDSVDLINLHANIQPVLSPNQLNSDGSPKNVKNGLGNVYNRNLTSTNNNEVRIEGNFMVINGSNLPYSNARSGSGLVGFAEAFEIVNVQIAIFNYNVTGTEPDTNKFTMNNLTIIGNTTVPSVNFGGTSEEILLQERLMSRNSGGYIGVMVNNGSSEFNNIQIRFAVIGISHYAYGEDVEMIVDQSIIKDSWANSMYMQGATKLTVTNSIYGQSGGSAFHLSDSRAGGGINNPTLIINNTEIENFISGEEAWFKAYGMTSVALQLKSGISQGIASTGRTIIDMVTHPVTGVQTEMINFILLTEPHTGAEVRDVNSNIIGGSEVSVTIDGKTTNRPYDYLSGSGDPRIQGGQFAYPMSLYSDQAAFMALITDIITIGAQNNQTISLQDASNLAFFGGFYNLTANELLAFATGQQTLMQILTSSPRAIPNYLEVLAPIPVFPTGYAVVIIELQ